MSDNVNDPRSEQDMAPVQKASKDPGEMTRQNESTFAAGRCVDGGRTVEFIQKVIGDAKVEVRGGYVMKTAAEEAFDRLEHLLSKTHGENSEEIREALTKARSASAVGSPVKILPMEDAPTTGEWVMGVFPDSEIRQMRWGNPGNHCEHWCAFGRFTPIDPIGWFHLPTNLIFNRKGQDK